jgi:hypothetical protein
MHCRSTKPPECGGFFIDIFSLLTAKLLTSKQGFQVAPAVDHAKNQHVLVVDAIDDDVFPDRRAS